jgi:hypothetical protein
MAPNHRIDWCQQSVRINPAYHRPTHQKGTICLSSLISAATNILQFHSMEDKWNISSLTSCLVWIWSQAALSRRWLISSKDRLNKQGQAGQQQDGNILVLTGSLTLLDIIRSSYSPAKPQHPAMVELCL